MVTMVTVQAQTLEAVTYSKLCYSRTELLISKDHTTGTLIFYMKNPLLVEKALTVYTKAASEYTEQITFTFPISAKITNINQQILLTGVDKVNMLLYVAVYWDPLLGDSPLLRVSVNPIEAKWYERL